MEPERPPKIRRIIKPDGKVVYDLTIKGRGLGECEPNPFSLTRQPGGVHVAEESLRKASDCINNVVKNVQEEFVEVNLSEGGEERMVKICKVINRNENKLAES